MKKFYSRLITTMILLTVTACSQSVATIPATTATSMPTQIVDTGSGPLMIGVLAPLTGPVATFGASTRNGVQMAIDEWNAKGGVLGRKVTAVFGDGQCDMNAAVSASNELIHQDKVHYVVGGICSSESLALAEIAEAQGVVEISPASTMDPLTLNLDGSTRQYIFRACYTDSFQGLIAGKFAAQNLKARRAYLLTVPNDTYTVNLAKSFEQAFTQDGGTIAGRGEYSTQDKDFSVLLSNVAASHPDIIYMASSYAQVNDMAKQARQQGMTTPFIGSDGWDSSDLDRVSLDGSYYTTHFSTNEQSPALQDWLKKYQARYQAAPDAIAVLGYDATNLLLEAIATAGQDNPAKVAAALAGLKWDGMTGTIQFNAQHNPVKPVVVMQVKNGKVEYLTTIQP